MIIIIIRGVYFCAFPSAQSALHNIILHILDIIHWILWTIPTGAILGEASSPRTQRHADQRGGQDGIEPLFPLPPWSPPHCATAAPIYEMYILQIMN